jgi:hypothetical protein
MVERGRKRGSGLANCIKMLSEGFGERRGLSRTFFDTGAGMAEGGEIAPEGMGERGEEDVLARVAAQDESSATYHGSTRVSPRKIVRRQCFLYCCAITVLSFLLGGCDVSREWAEEVRLTDGSVVIVKRVSTRERIGELGAAGYGRFKEEVLTFTNPLFAEWRGDTSPISVDIKGQDVFVVGWLRGWAACEKYGYPNPPFAYFRYSTGRGWEQIKAENVPGSLKQNLLLNPWQSAIENHIGVLRLQRKEELNKSVYQTLPSISEFHSNRNQMDHRDLLRCVRSPGGTN